MLPLICLASIDCGLEPRRYSDFPQRYQCWRHLLQCRIAYFIHDGLSSAAFDAAHAGVSLVAAAVAATVGVGTGIDAFEEGEFCEITDDRTCAISEDEAIAEHPPENGNEAGDAEALGEN